MASMRETQICPKSLFSIDLCVYVCVCLVMGDTFTLRRYIKCIHTSFLCGFYSYIHSHADPLRHAELWCTWKQQLRHLKLGMYSHILRLMHWYPTRDSHILNWMSVWAGTMQDNCIMFKDKEKTWQGVVWKKQMSFPITFPPLLVA